ncbi:MAG: PorT family protein, partial [Bacteroidales bacterium]|nr:PorT family protein [Bacteroidales bacterium]
MHKKLFLLFFIINSFGIFAQDVYEKPVSELLKNVLEIQKTKAKGFSFENFTMGIKGGVNFSLVIPTSGNSIFSGSTSEKDYNPFYQNFGYQMGFILRYSITRDIKISIQPSINEYSYRYSTEYSWTGSTNLNYLLEYQQSMRFFEIPLIAGYYFKAQKWQPYVQGGGYYAMLMNSNSYTDITETLDNQVLN